MSNFELFPNREGIIIDLADEPAGEPEEAADLGMPFIEPDPTHDRPRPSPTSGRAGSTGYQLVDGGRVVRR